MMNTENRCDPAEEGLARRQMKYICDTTEFYSEMPSAVTLGKFDGLHRGHQKLIREVVRLQKEQNLYGIVFTIAPENRKTLLTSEEKRELLEKHGINCMIHCPFIPEILTMQPETFVSEILVKQLKAKYIVVGTDFRFGYGRTGDVCLLDELQEKYDYTLVVLEKETYKDRVISSTYIKEVLEAGDVSLAENLLGYPYMVFGEILHGKKLGRSLGMPTINMIPSKYKIMPPEGVYFSNVLCKGKKYHGMTNIGYKPTVDGSFLGIETYLYGVNEDLYGESAEVSICSFRRREMKFASVEALKEQMELDIAAGKEYFGVS